MTKIGIILLLAVLLGFAFWSCPSRKIIPDPVPPQPQVTAPSVNMDSGPAKSTEQGL